MLSVCVGQTGANFISDWRNNFFPPNTWRYFLMISSNSEVFDQSYRGVPTALSSWPTGFIKAFRQWRRIIAMCSTIYIEGFHQLHLGVPLAALRCSSDTELFHEIYPDVLSVVSNFSTRYIEGFRWHRDFLPAVSMCSVDRDFSPAVSRCSGDVEFLNLLYRGVPKTYNFSTR